jgi:hypothetical protein
MISRRSNRRFAGGAAGGRIERVRHPQIGASRVGRSDDGAVLILALVYIIAVSLVVAALSTLAMNNLNNSPKFSSTVQLDSAASNMTQVAIQYVRYNPVISTSQASGVSSPLVACWGGDSIAQLPTFGTNDQIAVWCSTLWNPLLQKTRQVTFYACPISVLAAQCASPGNTLLEANVTFDDYPASPVSAPIQTLCTVLCGQGMTITSWIWGSSNAGSAAGVGVAKTMSFTTEPSDTVVNTTTSAAVKVLDANGNIVAGDTVALTSSGPNPLDPLSTMTAVTNTNGIASFSNLVPDYSGNYSLSAADGQATANSSNFVVTGLANTITPGSSPSSETTTGGQTFTPTATATGGTVTFSLDETSSDCTMNMTTGVVSFSGTANGTCLIDYNDTGTNIYAAAKQVQVSIPVVVPVNGSYAGYSSTTLINGAAYGIDTPNSVGNGGIHTANGLAISTGTTLTKLTYTVSATSTTTFTAAVGEWTGTPGTWAQVGPTCTISTGSKTCTVTISQSIAAGYSINLYSTGNQRGITGSWTVSYTQP